MKTQVKAAKGSVRRSPGPLIDQRHRNSALETRLRLGNARVGLTNVSNRQLRREVDDYSKLRTPRPGRCSASEHRQLQNEVSRACGRKRKCTHFDDCPVLWSNMQLIADCIRARLRLNFRCHDGGDKDHIDAINDQVRGLKNCWDIYNKKKCKSGEEKSIGASSLQQPAAESAGEQDFLKSLEKITGLSGTALLLYILVSEGSRLFPPRNLIPAP